jgi:hypothetical protein
MMEPAPSRFMGGQPAPPQDEPEEPHPDRELDACPRCGERIAAIVWGQTNCPRCGLHFECC